jgi:DNA segregation ATPase FtsK/SpoIIIE, S-DNA-T family
MAKNILNNPAKNQPKNDTQKVAEKEQPDENKKSFLKDRKFHLGIGIFLVFFSLYLVFAFTSYLFTGDADQSIISSTNDESMIDTAKASKNWVGLVGSTISNFFIFSLFGIASYLFIPIFFLIGYRIIFQKHLVAFGSFFKFSVFFMFWLSITFGYIINVSDSASRFSFLSGAIGFEIANLLNIFIGWGTPLVMLLSLIVFTIYYFNINSLTREKLTEVIEKEKEKLKEDDNLTPPVIVDETSKNDETEDEEIEEEIDDTTPLDADDWEVKTIEEDVTVPPIVVKPENIPLEITAPVQTAKKELEFTVEDTTPVNENVPVVDSVTPPVIATADQDNLVNDDDLAHLESLGKYDPTLELSHYQFPILDLLTDYPENKAQVTPEELNSNKDRIVNALGNFGIGIASIKATIGPTITLYEIVPEAGVRISKIKNLEDDIALSLSALGIRIIAPIPGKGTIGIEVPNTKKQMVPVKSVFNTEKFLNTEMDLPVVFGKTISNEVFITDLSKMPHLLMAGATGMGKSVGLNMILASLLFKKHPSQLKFVLVDPKKVELTLFKKIERHFLAKLPDSEESIITDTKKVIHTLNSLTIEMDNRYSLLQDADCRNIKEYNVKFVNRKLNPNDGHRYLPFIVLVIDELADLMITAGKEIEMPIARLAQMARAVGIHLVLATQRPSVNVITGVIKANFPARLSFRVTSKIDSRTILDEGGADQLVGQGDMLLKLGAETVRLQCAFVDTPEVERICDFIGNQRGYSTAYPLPEYFDDENPPEQKEVDLSKKDPLFEDAARILVQHQQGSTSLIQRKMRLGYNRAGSIVDQLEAAGILGPFQGSKAREVLIKDLENLEFLLNSLNNKEK